MRKAENAVNTTLTHAATNPMLSLKPIMSPHAVRLFTSRPISDTTWRLGRLNGRRNDIDQRQTRRAISRRTFRPPPLPLCSVPSATITGTEGRRCGNVFSAMGQRASPPRGEARGGFDLPAVAPSPDGDLRLEITCATGSAQSTRHDITIRPDWTVETPHDIEAERVAAAFGAEVSCIQLVERLIPAVRRHVQRVSRRALVGLRRVPDGSWSPDRAAPGCDCRRRFPSAAAAAAHLRTLRHTAHDEDLSVESLQPVLDAVLHAHRQSWGWRLPPGDAARARTCVLVDTDLDGLWQSGIHPLLVDDIHRRLRPDGPPLTEGFYLAVVTHRPDLDWLANIARNGSDLNGELLEWLAWTYSRADRANPLLRADWLAAGVSRAAISPLIDAGYVPADVFDLARCAGRSPGAMANLLHAWLQAGARPTVADLRRLFELRISTYTAPSRGVVLGLAKIADAAQMAISATDLALLQVICGSLSAAAGWLTRGYTDPFVVAEELARAEPRFDPGT